MQPAYLSDRHRETLALFERVEHPRTTTEVAESLDVDRQYAVDLLTDLAEDDRLDTRSIGDTARVWWRPREPVDDESTERGQTPPTDATTPLDDAGGGAGGPSDGQSDDGGPPGVDAADRIRSVTDTVLDRDTRESIEQEVCDGLVGSDGYRFAWVAAVNRQAQSLDPRAGAGDGCLADLPHSLEPADSAGCGPAGRAVRTQATQTVGNAAGATPTDSWQAYADRYGYRSLATVPIDHEDVLYGLVGVYTDAVDTFGDAAETAFTRLGGVVGQGIAAAERRRGLTSEQVTEVAIRVPNLYEADAPAAETAGTVTVDRTVAVGDDDFLEYGTVDGDPETTLTALADQVPHVEDFTLFGDESEYGFELRLSDPPLVSAVAAHGGSVRHSTFDHPDVRMTVVIPPCVETRDLLDTVRDIHAGTELLSQQRLPRSTESLMERQDVLAEDLTHRQRVAVETAHCAGYFEWPRASTGEEVAESLNISPATFHQHLRGAERKVVGTFLSDPVPERRE